MKKAIIRLPGVNSVQKFVHKVNEYGYEVDLYSHRFVIDAKSILGVLSINRDEPLEMHIYNDKCDDLLEDLAEFICCE